jgi:hypothetical protein
VTVLRARTTDGGTVTFQRTALATGGEKVVFPAVDGRHVVAFYHGVLRDRPERVARLDRIVTRFNPTRGAGGTYWGPYYNWPTAAIDGDSGIPLEFARDWHLAWPVLGIVVPRYRENFFFRDRRGMRREKEVKWFTGRKAGLLVPDDERGTLLTRLQVATRLARAVRRLHAAGLAHSDLSNKNVLVDLRGGDACLIDIDSLVVPGVSPPTVLGTPGYLAPETLARQVLPSVATDRHALAVLLVQLLLGRHPLEGRRVVSTRSAEEDERLSMGARALFNEHPFDRGNPPLDPIRVPYTALGPALARLIERAFIAGLHQPSRRPDAGEWESALYRTLEWIHPTPDLAGWTLAAEGLATSCPWTGLRVGASLPVARYVREGVEGRVDERRALTLFHHLRLHDWHLRRDVRPDERADRTPRAYVAWHREHWWIVNVGDLHVRTADGMSFGRGDAVALHAGLSLRLDHPEARWLTVDFLQGAGRTWGRTGSETARG